MKRFTVPARDLWAYPIGHTKKWKMALNPDGTENTGPWNIDGVVKSRDLVPGAEYATVVLE